MINETGASQDDKSFDVWSTQFGHVGKLKERATKETASCFVFGRRRRSKDCGFQQLRRTQEECEAIASIYREKEARKSARQNLNNAAPLLLAALERTLSWLTSYPGEACMGPDGPYEQAKAAIAAAKSEPSKSAKMNSTVTAGYPTATCTAKQTSVAHGATT